MLARLTQSAAALQHTLLDLLFPPRCVICRRMGQWFCAACRASIEKVQPPICERCGRPLQYRRCPHCEEFPLQIEGTRALAFFEGNLRDAIHAFKYGHRPELAETLGEMLSDYLSTYPLPADVIVAVPLHPQRERERGYNQSLLLARVLGARNRLPVMEQVVTRNRVTRPQVELGGSERHANMRDAFTAADSVGGARVLLIDDVCSTGATMDACGIALKAQGAKSVWGLAVARSRQKA